jgi:hypothetical protein
MLVFGGMLFTQHSPTSDTAGVSVEVSLDPSDTFVPAPYIDGEELGVAVPVRSEVLTLAFRPLSPLYRQLFEPLLISREGLDDAISGDVATGRAPGV